MKKPLFIPKVGEKYYYVYFDRENSEYVAFYSERRKTIDGVLPREDLQRFKDENVYRTFKEAQKEADVCNENRK